MLVREIKSQRMNYFLRNIQYYLLIVYGFIFAFDLCHTSQSGWRRQHHNNTMPSKPIFAHVCHSHTGATVNFTAIFVNDGMLTRAWTWQILNMIPSNIRDGIIFEFKSCWLGDEHIFFSNYTIRRNDTLFVEQQNNGGLLCMRVKLKHIEWTWPQTADTLSYYIDWLQRLR